MHESCSRCSQLTQSRSAGLLSRSGLQVSSWRCTGPQSESAATAVRWRWRYNAESITLTRQYPPQDHHQQQRQQTLLYKVIVSRLLVRSPREQQTQNHRPRQLSSLSTTADNIVSFGRTSLKRRISKKSRTIGNQLFMPDGHLSMKRTFSHWIMRNSFLPFPH